jgi:glucose-6-phosphate dehydrogenase assembly protein OpcA
MAPSLKDTSIAEIERLLDDLHDGDGALQRTSVLTHIAWVPSEWERAAGRVLEGMGARIPSRTILLHPDPGAGADRLDAEVGQERFESPSKQISAELIRIWLRGSTARAPASVVVPLQIPDLPAFLRWRGKPACASAEFEQLVGVTDRLIVDSREWGDRLRPAYRELAGWFDRIVVSDLAWSRGLGHRAGLAGLWPGITTARVLEVRGPRADAALLHGWLRARLKSGIRLRHEEGRSLTRVAVDGRPVRVPLRLASSASDQLSDQLEVYTRDRVYEAAVRAV